MANINISNLFLTLPSESGNVNILKDINLSIEKKEIVAITGASGAGKTSLLMILAGLEAPTKGNVTIDGHDIVQMSETQLAIFRRKHIGIIFQNFHLIDSMNALENVALPLEFAGENDALEKAKEILAMVGLAERMTHYPSQLSGGEQQRVGLARALAPKPSVILADEPTGNLDEDNSDLATELLFSLCEQQESTMLLITHDNLLAKKCPRQIQMQDGQLKSDNKVKA